ncbi:hypothetical protein SH449x_000552 [Pirellulaceae bacterium SH449]
MTFTESNTAEQLILEVVTNLGSGASRSVVRAEPLAGWGGSLGEEFKPLRWNCIVVDTEWKGGCK